MKKHKMSVLSGKYDSNQDNDDLYRLDDPDLDARIKSFRKAEFELDEIRNDPFLEQARMEVASMMLSFDELKRKDSSKEAEEFIKSSLGKRSSKEAKELKDIKIEISKSDINDLSAEWVREWHRKKQMQVPVSAADKERENFVKASLTENRSGDAAAPEPKVATLHPEKSVEKTDRRKIIRFTSIAAAAVLGAFIAIRTLVPGANPDKIYDNFYRTYSAVSLTTRGIENNVAEIYNSAVSEYRNSRFSEAARLFRMAASEDPSFGSPFFFLGLSQLETGNIEEAILSFNTALKSPGNYAKESKWYLGLAYLKKNDSSKAAECFRELASSDGYYRESSEKILRRLK